MLAVKGRVGFVVEQLSLVSSQGEMAVQECKHGACYEVEAQHRLHVA